MHHPHILTLFLLVECIPFVVTGPCFLDVFAKLHSVPFSSHSCKHIIRVLFALPLKALSLLSRIYLYWSDICLCVFFFVEPGKKVG